VGVCAVTHAGSRTFSTACKESWYRRSKDRCPLLAEDSAGRLSCKGAVPCLFASGLSRSSSAPA
jgi:hypothetical protein